MAAGAGRPVVLVDLDPGSGGLDLLLGLATVPGARWPVLRGLTPPIDGASLRGALPGRGSVAVLTHDRCDPVPHASAEPGPLPTPAAGALDALSGLDVLVIADHPVTAAVAGAEGVHVLVTAVEARSVAAAARRLAGCRAADAAGDGRLVHLVTRGLPSGGAAPEVVAEVLGLPLLAHLPFDPRLPAHLAELGCPGLPPRSPLVRVAGRIVDLLGLA